MSQAQRRKNLQLVINVMLDGEGEMPPGEETLGLMAVIYLGAEGKSYGLYATHDEALEDASNWAEDDVFAQRMVNLDTLEMYNADVEDVSPEL